MTSITDLNLSAESQGVVTGEAHACGLPVVAFDSGGVKYTIKKNQTGFLCPEQDISCFVSKIEILINDASLRSQMGRNAREYVLKKLSNKSIEEKWNKIYCRNVQE